MICIKGKRSYLINIAIILMIGGLSLYLSAGKNLSSMWQTLMNANPVWVLVLVCLMTTYYIFDGISMWVFGVYYNKNFKVKDGFVTGMIGTLFSDLTPSSSGGQFAQVYIYNEKGVPPTTSTGILTMAFISYQLVIMGYMLVIMLFGHTYIFATGTHVMVMALCGFGINMAVTLVLFLGASSKRFQNGAIRTCVLILHKLRIVKHYRDTYDNICRTFTDFREKFTTLMQHKELLIKCSLCNVVKMSCLYSMPFFACRAVHLEVHWSQYFQFMAMASVIHLLNAFLPIPGASGGSEGSFILLFGFLGSEVSSAMLLWRVFAFYYGAILGMIIFTIHQRHSREKEEALEDPI